MFYSVDKDLSRSFIFIEKSPNCGHKRDDVPRYLNPNIEKKLNWKPEQNWTTESSVDSVSVPEEWQVQLEPGKCQASGGRKSQPELTGWYLVSDHQKEVAKRAAMMTLNRNNSRFTSYVDLDSNEDPADLELEMKPNLLDGEMMITQADKVCLYSSQFGG